MNLIILLPCILLCLIGGGRAVLDCKHGGIYVVDENTQEDQCNCPPYWDGQTCEELKCANGGYAPLDDDSFCVCPSGYHGVHCDPVGPIPSPDKTFAVDSSVHFVVVDLFTPDGAANALATFKSATTSLLKSTAFSSAGILYSTAAPENADDIDVPEAYAFENSVETDTSKIIDLIADLNNRLLPYNYTCFTVPFAGVVHNYVKKWQIQHTTLNVITQHPPRCDDPNNLNECNDLIATLIAFDIKLNVFFVQDAYTCTDDEMKSLRDISKQSGGQFVVYVNEEAVMTTLLATTYLPQLITSGATSSNETQLFPAVLDPLSLGMYHYLVVSGGSFMGTTTGCMSTIAASTNDDSFSIYKVFAMPSNNMTYECDLKLQASNSTQLYAQLYSSDYDPKNSISLNTFVSFVDDKGLDSAASYPNERNPLHVRVHYEAALADMQLDSAVVYSAVGTSMSLTFEPTLLSTFDYVSNETISCTAVANPYSIQLRFVSSTNSSIMQQRSIYFNCYDRPADPVTSSTAYSTAITDVPTTAPKGGDGEDVGVPEVGDAADSSSTCTIFNVADNPVTSTLVIAVSDAIDVAKYNTFSVATIAPATQAYFNNFGAIRYDGKDTGNVQYTNETSADLFLDVYNGFFPTGSDPLATTSDILKILSQEVTDGIRASPVDQKYIPQNSLVSVALGRLPASPDNFNPDDYQQLIHQNSKVVFFLDYEYTQKQLGQGTTLSGLSTLAALTDGHLIVTNQSDVNNYFNALRAVYDFGPAQQLIYSQNFIGGRINLAAPLDLTNLLDDEVLVSFTATTLRNGGGLVDMRAYFFDLMIVSSDPNGTAITIPLTTNFTQDPLSNFYFSTVSLKAGKSYALRINYISSQPNDIVHMRAWVDKSKYPQVYIRYDDLSDSVTQESIATTWQQTESKNVRYPNSVDGAIVRATVSGIAVDKLTISMIDCNGLPLGLFDEIQIADRLSPSSTTCSDHNYVPYFCMHADDETHNTKNCVPGTEGKYTMQITGNGVSATRSFYCNTTSPTSTPDPAECKRPTLGGDYQCLYSNPMRRGPSAQVYDCSGTGKLVYVPNPLTGDAEIKYRCQCDPTSTDQNCADAACDVKNTRAGADDTSYRTYTVALIKGPTSDLTIQMGTPLLKPQLNATNVWIYQLLEFCGERVAVRYFGPSQTQFAAAFGALTLHCDDEATDLGYIYKTAVGGLGPQHRGLLTVFTADTTNLAAASSLDDFYDVARRYRQEMFVFIFGLSGSYDTKTVGEMTYATGGSVIWSKPKANPADLTPFPDYMLNAKPSLNYHNKVGSTQVLPAVVESRALVFYSGMTTENTPPSADGVKVPQFWGNAYYVDAETKLLEFTGLTDSPYSISVVAIGSEAVTPAFCLVSGQTSDAPSALAVATTNTRARLVVKVDDADKISSADSRILKRKECTFNVLSYDVFENFDGEKGAKTLTLNYVTPNNFNVVKYFPVIVTATGDGACLNDGVWNVDHCDCPPGFMGPDCSLVSSCNDGTPNTWGTACTCKDADGTEGTGRTCSDTRQPPAPGKSSLWHDFL